MSGEENKAVIRRAAEAASSGDFDAFDELMAPDVAAEYKEGVAELRRAFPDYHGADEIQIAEGNLVAGRFVFYGTYEGEFMGVAPTGRQVTFRGLSLNRLADDDVLRQERPWPFRLDEIGADVRFHHGEDDTLASPQHAKKLAEGMPGSRLHLYPGEGHISILDRPIKKIVETLLAP